MSKRTELRKKNTVPNRKRWSAALIGILMLLVIGVGLYSFISQTPETDAALEELKKTSFTERGYSGGMLAEIEVQEVEALVSEGTVIDKREPKEEESEEEADEAEEVSLVEAPEKDLSSMIANAKASVFTVYTDMKQGSGFLINESGDILTNAHVVKDAVFITVKSSSGQEFNGRIIGISDTADIALVRVEDMAGKQPLPIELEKASVGTKVFAIGSPENISNTSTEGEITATDKSFVDGYQYDDLYEMTANIKRGSSGGPLISADTGNVLGINSIILTDQPEIGYAIPLFTVIEQLNAWVADPITYEEEDIVYSDTEDAYFDEELLRNFISDFYELIPYSLNDDEVAYYQFFLLPGSQGETAGEELVENMKGKNREFEAAERSITNLIIEDEKAVVNATATFTYHNKETDELETFEHSAVYTIVIDEFGDYRISEMALE